MDDIIKERLIKEIRIFLEAYPVKVLPETSHLLYADWLTNASPFIKDHETAEKILFYKELKAFIMKTVRQ